MKNYKTWIAFIMIVTFWGCEKKIDVGVHEVHWDRDMCVRCKMVVSERQYAAQTTDPSTGKTYYFDDIGCVILWFEEDKVDWADKAIIWVTDVNSGEWINAKEARWSTVSVTPMAFGYAAHKPGSEPEGEVIGYDEMARRAIALEEKKKRRY